MRKATVCLLALMLTLAPVSFGTARGDVIGEDGPESCRSTWEKP